MATIVTELTENPYSGDRTGRKLQRSFRVRLDDGSVIGAEYLAASAPEIPYLFTAHPTVSGVWAKRITSNVVGGDEFKVIVEYDDVREAGNNQTTGIAPGSESAPGSSPSSASPPDRTPVVKVGARSVEKRPQKWDMRYSALDPFLNAPLVNSADEPLEIVMTRNLGVIDLTYYRAGANFYDSVHGAIQWHNGINDATWAGFPAGTLRCSDKTFEYVFEAGGCYRRVNLKIEYDPKGWVIQVANVGLREKKTVTAGVFKYVPILDETGQPITTPVPLNLDGTRRTSGDVLFIDVLDGQFMDFSQIMVY